ncbi:Fanconi anemia group B protein [Bagarius yarrelli]|uniref:Fanconi anemia group B protein n=1 Tax=Bagarius yarrelli TaxID=175774 RepID=A0A556VC47_BAGYA|nr:Fanconi anemia group B protein [Bagarius yarrelli]
MTSAHQCFHMATLHGDLLIFQCKHTSSRGSEVAFWRMSFNEDSGTFFNRDNKITMYENSSKAVSIVHCTTAVNVKTRLRVLCILLRLHQKGSHGFKYMLYSLSSTTRAVLHVEFSLPYKMPEDVFILRGPTLIWCHKGVVFYTSAKNGSIKEVPIHLYVNFLGELPLSQRLAVVGLQKMSEDKSNGNDCDNKAVLYFLEDGRIFSADYVAACWTDVHLLLVDDFVRAGSEQMLLLFEEVKPADGIPEKFLLTDLCDISYSRGNAESVDVNWCAAAEENVKLTIQALEARLQEGLVSLLDKQSEEVECTPHVSLEMNSVESLLKVERCWHRVVGQKLVFGALLSPTDQLMDYENMIAAIIAPTVQSVNKIIFYPKPLTSVAPGPPNNKRIKYSSGPAILIATDLLLTFDPVKCSGLLGFFTKKAGSASQHCKLVNIDLKGALEGKFLPYLLEDCGIVSDESREDLLSLMVAFESWSFHILSMDCSIMDVSLFLEKNFKAKQIKNSPEYLLSCSKQLSGAMLFHWKPCSSVHGMLDVYCSNHLGLLHFLDTLCNLLPVSHSIKLFKTGQARNKKPAFFLDHEICMIKESMAVLTNSRAEDLRSYPIVQINREQWLKEKLDQLCPLVEVKLYRQMVKKAISLKMISDVAMLVKTA